MHLGHAPTQVTWLGLVRLVYSYRGHAFLVIPLNITRALTILKTQPHHDKQSPHRAWHNTSLHAPDLSTHPPDLIGNKPFAWASALSLHRPGGRQASSTRSHDFRVRIARAHSEAQ